MGGPLTLVTIPAPLYHPRTMWRGVITRWRAWDGEGSGPAVARLFHVLLGAVFLIAFWSLSAQIDVLISARGLLPVAPLLDQLAGRSDVTGWDVPSVLWLGASDGAIRAWQRRSDGGPWARRDPRRHMPSCHLALLGGRHQRGHGGPRRRPRRGGRVVRAAQPDRQLHPRGRLRGHDQRGRQPRARPRPLDPGRLWADPLPSGPPRARGEWGQVRQRRPQTGLRLRRGAEFPRPRRRLVTGLDGHHRRGRGRGQLRQQHRVVQQPQPGAAEPLGRQRRSGRVGHQRATWRLARTARRGEATWPR